MLFLCISLISTVLISTVHGLECYCNSNTVDHSRNDSNPRHWEQFIHSFPSQIIEQLGFRNGTNCLNRDSTCTTASQSGFAPKCVALKLIWNYGIVVSGGMPKKTVGKYFTYHTCAFSDLNMNPGCQNVDYAGRNLTLCQCDDSDNCNKYATDHPKLISRPGDPTFVRSANGSVVRLYPDSILENSAVTVHIDKFIETIAVLMSLYAVGRL